MSCKARKERREVLGVLTKWWKFYMYKRVRAAVRCQFRSTELVDGCIFCRYCRQGIKLSPWGKQSWLFFLLAPRAPNGLGCFQTFVLGSVLKTVRIPKGSHGSEEPYLPAFTIVCSFIKIHLFLGNTVRRRHANCKSRLLWKGLGVSCIQCGIFISA